MRSILLALCIASALTIDINDQMTNHQQQVMAEIRESSWGSWILDFAQIHLETQGFLDNLLSAIHEVVDDLESELNTLTDAFNKRTDQHNKDVELIGRDIEDAQRDIFNGSDMIDNVLIPQTTRLSKALAQLKDNIKQNRQSLDRETLNRKNEKNAFETKVGEHNDAISAVDECLELLSSISNPSLLQVNKVQSNLALLQKKLNNHSDFAPLVKALIELATEQNFSDQGAVKQIVVAFGELRKELVASVLQLTADEQVAIKNFAAREKSLNDEHLVFQRNVLLRNSELTRTNEKTTETTEFVKGRKVDLATFQAQLDQENDDFARETQIFQDLKTQYQKELGACNAALGLLTQQSFMDYVKAKIGF